MYRMCINDWIPYPSRGCVPEVPKHGHIFVKSIFIFCTAETHQQCNLKYTYFLVLGHLHHWEIDHPKALWWNPYLYPPTEQPQTQQIKSKA